LSLGLSSYIETLKNARQKSESRESQLKRFKKLATDVGHLTAKECQAPEKTNIKESYNKSERPHAPNRERERGAHTQRATQESEKTTDSEHIGPPEYQSSLSRRQFRVKQFFFPALFWTNGYIFQQKKLFGCKSQLFGCQGKKLTHSSKEEAPASLLYRNRDKKKPLLSALLHPVLLQSS
jgi:hypothetical protein